MNPPLLIAYYGDDFTGSTDVMEVLQWSGLRTVLFLAPPTMDQLAKFDGLRAFGVAGWSRTMSTIEMERELPSQFEALRDSGAPLIHYKVCSTFDSSPQIGNIGKALEIGRRSVSESIVPIVVGAPNLGRFQVFGNLFARSGTESDPLRLDRHPTMNQHPITPMLEADLRVVLSTQTELAIGLIDLLRLNKDDPKAIVESLQTSNDAGTLIDVLEPEQLQRIGKILEGLCRETSNFVIGSSGVESSLTAHWLQSGRLSALQTRPSGRPTFGSSGQIIVVSGSCSPVTARQIEWGDQNGFEPIDIQVAKLVHPETSEEEIESIVDRALLRLKAGANILLNSSRGPSDPRVAATHKALHHYGLDSFGIKLRSSRIIGPLLGQVLSAILELYPIQRVGIAGGDTSGYIARCLGIEALEAIAPLAPGAPLCRVFASNKRLDGMEFLFKGGQVGRDDIWKTLLQGTDGSA